MKNKLESLKEALDDLIDKGEAGAAISDAAEWSCL